MTDPAVSAARIVGDRRAWDDARRWYDDTPAAPVATTTATGAPVAADRAETDPCERGTPGCCVRHDPGTDHDCDTW